ncbi:hypothetical protein MJO29_002109 [Puccinia striiformis f. sp. tritici]|nr:hypothetical protein MJO29_002109 [Puccinia striiformis f. sp. tritici]
MEFVRHFFQRRARTETEEQGWTKRGVIQNQASTTPTEPNQEEEDCLGCRLIGASASVLAGSYILTQEINRRRTALVRSKPIIPVRPIGARFMQLIGWSFIGLGLARVVS